MHDLIPGPVSPGMFGDRWREEERVAAAFKDGCTSSEVGGVGRGQGADQGFVVLGEG